MATCDHCGTMILFGGIREGDRRYCGQPCHEQGLLVDLTARQVSLDELDETLREIHEGECPKCGGPGPVDVHVSHTVWSLVIITSWRSRNLICCQSCGTKSKISAAFSSALLGWWGFPWGFVMTPIQIIRNIASLSSNPDPNEPSSKLEKIVRLSLANSLLEEREDRRARAGS